MAGTRRLAVLVTVVAVALPLGASPLAAARPAPAAAPGAPAVRAAPAVPASQQHPRGDVPDLPLGPPGTTQTASQQTLAPGVRLTTIVRGRSSRRDS